MKLKYFGQINEFGELFLTNKKGFEQDLLDFKGKNVVLTIETKSKRSEAQNRFFHGPVIDIIRNHLLDLGWKEAKSKEWVKNYIKLNCLIRESVNEETGEVIRYLAETSQLTKDEFAGFIADVQQWCAEKLELVIPDPGQIDLDFERTNN